MREYQVFIGEEEFTVKVNEKRGGAGLPPRAPSASAYLSAPAPRRENASAASAPVQAAKPTAKTSVAVPAFAASGSGEQILAPMPGSIITVSVSNGQQVKKGQVLLTFEAMKMENEIMCPRDGIVASLNVTQGASVDTGTLLCVIQ